MPLSTDEIVANIDNYLWDKSESAKQIIKEAFINCPIEVEDVNDFMLLVNKVKNLYRTKNWTLFILHAGDLRWVRKLIESNQFPINGLHDLAESKNLESLKYALNTLPEKFAKALGKGASHSGYTLAHFVALTGDLECLKLCMTHPKYANFFVTSTGKRHGNIAHVLSRTCSPTNKSHNKCLVYLLANFPSLGLAKTSRGKTLEFTYRNKWEDLIKKVKSLNPEAAESIDQFVKSVIDAESTNDSTEAKSLKRNKPSSNELDEVRELKRKLELAYVENAKQRQVIEALTKVNTRLARQEGYDSIQSSTRVLISQVQRRGIAASSVSQQLGPTMQPEVDYSSADTHTAPQSL